MKLYLRFVYSLAALLLLSVPCALPLAAQSHSQGPAATFDSLSKRADAARDADNLDLAAKLYHKALVLKPDWKEGWWSLGTIYYDSKRYAEGMVAFERLIKLAPTDGTTNLMLGLCEYEMGEYGNSRKHLDAAWKLGIQDAPDLEPQLLYHQVLLKLRARQFEGALDTLGHMLRMFMRSDDVIVATGMAVLRMTPDELPPAGSPAYEIVKRVGFAEAMNYSDTHQRARELYEQVVRDAPDFPNIHYAYGRFLMNIDQSQAAEEEFKAALKRDPKNYNAMLKLALLDYHKDSAAGIPYAEEVLKIAPNYPVAHYLLGILSLDAGDVDRAVKELEIARKLMPGEPQVAYSLANAYVKAHRNQDAMRERQAFVKLKAAQKEDDSQTNYDVKANSGMSTGEQEPGVQEEH